MYRPFLVTLDEQVKNLEQGKFDEFSQYVVVRQMNKLLKTSSRESAEAFAKKFIGSLPDFAILYKLFELDLKSGNLTGALEYAQAVFDRNIPDNAGYVSLLMETANLLSMKKGEASVLAMKICERLLDAEMDGSFDRHLVGIARRIFQNNTGIHPSERMKNLFEKVDKELAAEAEAERKRLEEKKEGREKKVAK